MSLGAKLVRMHAELDPRDRADARWYMCRETWQAIRAETATYVQGPAPLDDGIFGIPVEIDDTLSLGVISLIAETELDKAVRRAAQRGQVLKVMQPFPLPEVFPAPSAPPTLRALLAHWLKKVKR